MRKGFEPKKADTGMHSSRSCWSSLAEAPRGGKLPVSIEGGAASAVGAPTHERRRPPRRRAKTCYSARRAQTKARVWPKVVVCYWKQRGGRQGCLPHGEAISPRMATRHTDGLSLARMAKLKPRG